MQCSSGRAGLRAGRHERGEVELQVLEAPLQHPQAEQLRVGASLIIRTAERRLRLAVGVFLGLVAIVYFVTQTRALLEQL